VKEGIAKMDFRNVQAATSDTTPGAVRQALDETKSEAEKARLAAEAESRERISAEERARKKAEDRTVWEQLAADQRRLHFRTIRRDAGVQRTTSRCRTQLFRCLIPGSWVIHSMFSFCHQQVTIN
jgi:hypothetical protein